MHVRLVKSFSFDAAHHLPCFPEGHKCRAMHGHTYTVDVVLEGALAEGEHYLIDFADVKAAIEPVRKRIDHQCLNDVPGLEVPTVERIAAWLWEELAAALPMIAEIIVHESPTARCEYRGPAMAPASPGSGQRAEGRDGRL